MPRRLTPARRRVLTACHVCSSAFKSISTGKETAMHQKWITVLQAADTAARWHVSQKRKGENAEPYINHLLRVAAMVTEATNGKDPELAIAALLHDAIEDQQISREAIAEQFGEDVASLVEEVTDDKNLPKQERKDLQVKNAPNKSDRAKIIKLADKTSNLLALADSPPADWSTERRQEYVVWARQVVAGLRGTCPSLEAQFDAAAKQAEAAAQALSDPRSSPKPFSPTAFHDGLASHPVPGAIMALHG
jgi:(p)ppGpp synthase/HD superfamily hydrolase